MHLFKDNELLFNDANLKMRDLIRRRDKIRAMWKDYSFYFDKELEACGMIHSESIAYAYEDKEVVESLKDTYICDIRINIGDSDDMIMLTVLSDELICNMTWFNMEDCKEMFGRFMYGIIPDMLFVSDIKCIKIYDIKSECIKDWCRDYGFEIDTGFMNKPDGYDTVDMIIRR